MVALSNWPSNYRSETTYRHQCQPRSCSKTNLRWRSWTGHERESGVGAAIHGEIRSGDVRGFRAGDKRYQRGNLVDSAVAIQGGVVFLGSGPIARSGIEIGVDRTGL